MVLGIIAVFSRRSHIVLREISIDLKEILKFFLVDLSVERELAAALSLERYKHMMDLVPLVIQESLGQMRFQVLVIKKTLEKRFLEQNPSPCSKKTFFVQPRKTFFCSAQKNILAVCGLS